MQPIWKEQIQMWYDKGLDIPITEGTYWINNQVIKAYDAETGSLCNLYRIKVNDDLTMSYKEHNDYAKHEHKHFETWAETAKRNEARLQDLEHNAIALLQEAADQYPEHEIIVLTSTGKDSTIVEHIAKLSGIMKRGQIVFNNTTLDVADTYQMALRNGYTITNPREGFYQYIKRLDFIPTRFGRGCCTVFKEGNFKKYFENSDRLLIISGVRNSESNNRAEYGDYVHNPKYPDDWISVLPIRHFEDEDVWTYILSRGLEINPKYKKGYQRVGCAIACPFYTKSTWVLDQYWYPNLYDRWHKILEEDFIKNEKWTKLNCTLAEYHSCWPGGILREEPTAEVVEEFAEHKSFAIPELAKAYFNKTCPLCSENAKTKNVRQSEVIAMNLKMHGRSTDTFFCKKHLMEQLHWTDEDWQSHLKRFKRQECELF